MLDKLPQRRHLGESRSHLRGERGDPYLGRRKLHTSLGDPQSEGLRWESDLRAPEHIPVFLRGGRLLNSAYRSARKSQFKTLKYRPVFPARFGSIRTLTATSSPLADAAGFA